jgi:hypothetical protein
MDKKGKQKHEDRKTKGTQKKQNIEIKNGEY